MRKSQTKFTRVTLIGLLTMGLATTDIGAQEVSVGIKGGLNLSYLTIDEADRNNFIPGVHGGVFAYLIITEKLGIQPEVLYSMRGVKTVYNEEFLGFDVADGETNLRLSYIDIPVYLRFNLSDNFDIHIGPYIGFLMNATTETNAEIIEFIDIDNVEDIDRSEFNSMDYGLSAGLGLNFDPMTIGVNYNLGLHQVAKEDAAMDDLIGDAKNQTIQFYVGLSF